MQFTRSVPCHTALDKKRNEGIQQYYSYLWMNSFREEVKTNQEKMEARIDANNETLEVLRGTLISRMDIH
jgi:hypothetical protein